MILWLALAGLLQGPQTWSVLPSNPTVGDTVIIRRLLPGPPGVRIRARPLSPSSVLEPLDEPQVERAGSALVLSYAAAFFEAGELSVPMPSAELIYADGTTELILGDTAKVRIASVLPATDTLPQPQPSLGPLARDRKSVWPAVWLGLSVIVAAGVWVYLRRRPRQLPVAARGKVSAVEPPLERWAAAGEVRAVATVAYHKLRRTIDELEPRVAGAADPAAMLKELEELHPHWPHEEIGDLLRELDRARFAPVVASDALALDEQVVELCRVLRSLESEVHVRET
ncbi:MAG: hypothetical protein KatS3mg081_0530 [Gemmatimonadales bacterium]|nr:MAG: hypothetical protein KatS3mg081_0530 [Gemmatimonadales bacterium]